MGGLSFEEADSGVQINSHRRQEKVGPRSKLFPITSALFLDLTMNKCGYPLCCM